MIDWEPGRAIVLGVDPADVPQVTLPPDATPLPPEALHVTLVSRHSLQPHVQLLVSLWPQVVHSLPPPPKPQLEPRLALATRPGKRTWFLRVNNVLEFQTFLAQLVQQLDVALAGFRLDEPTRYCHVSLANDAGGDPMASISAITEQDWLASVATVAKL